MNKLIDFWKEFKPDIEVGYIHSSDIDLINKADSKKKKLLVSIKSFETYVKWVSSNESDSGKTLIHSGLLPIPYIGDIRKAKVLFLLLNPGVDSSDYYAEYNDGGLRKSILDTIYQENLSLEYPFFLLSPRYAWTAGGKYWRKKLRRLAELIAKEGNNNLEDSYRFLAKNIAAFQWLPYRSASYKHNKIFGSLESTELVVKELQSHAKNKSVLIYILRSSDKWQIGDYENVVINSRGHTRSAYVDFEKINESLKTLYKQI